MFCESNIHVHDYPGHNHKEFIYTGKSTRLHPNFKPVFLHAIQPQFAQYVYHYDWCIIYNQETLSEEALRCFCHLFFNIVTSSRLHHSPRNDLTTLDACLIY